MKKSERHLKIREILQEKGRTKVTDLAALLETSAETIRADLEQLEEQSLIIKEHGWARINKSIDVVPLVYRFNEDLNDKQRISVRALQEIKDGQIVYIDGGSTILAGIRLLKSKNDITIVTDSFSVVSKCMEMKINTIFLGGDVHLLEQRTGGYFAIQMINHLQIDLAILGSRGIKNTNGFTTVATYGIELMRHVIDHCEKVIVVCDQNKFQKNGSFVYANFNEIDTLITNVLSDEQFELVKDIKTIIQV